MLPMPRGIEQEVRTIMIQTVEKTLVAIGGLMALAALLVFGLGASTTVGLETDVEAPKEPDSIALGVDGNFFGPGQEIDVTVNVLDAGAQPVAGATCTFSILSQPGDDASIYPGPVTSDAAGNARTRLQVGTTGGTVEIAAACGDATNTLSLEVEGNSDDAAEPPASLPDSGAGPNDSDSMRAVLVALLAGIGLSTAGTGLLVGRLGRRRIED
jgi:hypothetical protein